MVGPDCSGQKAVEKGQEAGIGRGSRRVERLGVSVPGDAIPQTFGAWGAQAMNLNHREHRGRRRPIRRPAWISLVGPSQGSVSANQFLCRLR